MTNELCGGSIYAPDSTGRKVPIELSLAIHSDAGHTETGLGVYGSLSICTTQFGDSCLAAGISRDASKELASSLLNNLTTDLQYNFGEWTKRRTVDRNYSETRLPIVPSAILEILSHQNFGDMRYGLDPNFRFSLARSVYKTVVRHISKMHQEKAVIQPLAPQKFHIEFTKKEGEIQLSWQGVVDGQEPSSIPTGYLLHIAQNDEGFDNGTLLRGTSCTIRLVPGVLYSFKVTAVNDGGNSFPTETLSALYQPGAKSTVLIVNGFRRLSSPAIVKDGQGFDINDDIGVTYGRTAGWLGLQRGFNVETIGVVDSTGLGFTTSDLKGLFIAGNEFNYVRTHADAIRTAGLYNIVSSSAKCIEDNEIDLSKYQVIDLILGLEKDDGHSLVHYKSLHQAMQERLRDYTASGGNLMVSGAYVGSDMTTDEEKSFLSDVLKLRFEGTNCDLDENIQGMGTSFSVYRQLNETHYSVPKTDILMPEGSMAAFPALVYNNRTSAAVAYQGQDYRTFTIGFPFECIKEKESRESIMRGILKFLVFR